MDYEKKIREYMNSSKLYKDILSILFPELAESEDEKIRKEIVDFITSSNKYGTNERCEAWLNWLEKQGTSYTKRDVDNAYVEGMAFAKDELEKQKPTWSEEDDSILSDIVNHFDGIPIKHQTHEIFGWLVSLKHRIGG